VTLATAHAAAGDGVPEIASTVPSGGTIVFYMGLGRVAQTCAALVAAGRSPRTPAAVIARATRPDQRVVEGTLADLAERVRQARLEAPALLVVGEVVARRVESPAAPDGRGGEREGEGVGAGDGDGDGDGVARLLA
jgi:siroheme synthase